MHSDLTVQHISLTCPNCGKQYKKVPYAAIKQFHFAFCKKCNLKFQISPQELEDALREALGMELPQQAAAAPHAPAPAPAYEDPPSEPAYQAPAVAEQDLFAEAEPQPREGAFPAAGEPLQEEAPAQTGLEQALEQKLTDLAATMDETFSPPDEFAGPAAEEQAAEPPAFAEYAPAPDLEGPPAEIEINFAADEHIGPDSELLEAAGGEPETEPAAGEPALAQEFAAQQEEAAAGLAAEGPAAATDFPLDGISMEFSEEPALFGGQQEEAQEARPEEEMPAPYPGEDLEPLSSDDDVFDAILSQDLAGQAAGEYGREEQLAREEFLPGEQEPAGEGEEAAVVEPALEELPLEQDQTAASPSLPEAAAAEEPAAEEPQLYYDQQGHAVADLFSEHAQDGMPEALQEFAEEEPPEEEFAEEPAAQQQYQAPVYEEPGAGPGQELYPEAAGEEPLASEAGEELFDDELLEEAPEDSAEPPQPYLQPPPPDTSLFDAIRQGDGSARDISSMLKDLVQPSADIEEGMEQFVLFTLGEQGFAISIANVLELSLPPDTIPVPNTPGWIAGICNLRGEITSVVDLRGFLNIDGEAYRKPTRMIIAQTKDRAMSLGLLVDRINGIQYFHVDRLQPLDQPAPGISGTFATGTAEHEDAAVVFLDLEQILQSPKMRQFQ